MFIFKCNIYKQLIYISVFISTAMMHQKTHAVWWKTYEMSEGSLSYENNICQEIKNGADTTAADHCGDGLLHYAAEFYYREVVKLLIKTNIDINLKNKTNWTALHRAALHNHTEIVKLLIDAGADINLKDNYGLTALNYATVTGNTEMIGLLKKMTAITTALEQNDIVALNSTCEEVHSTSPEIFSDKALVQLLVYAAQTTGTNADMLWDTLYSYFKDKSVASIKKEHFDKFSKEQQEVVREYKNMQKEFPQKIDTFALKHKKSLDILAKWLMRKMKKDLQHKKYTDIAIVFDGGCEGKFIGTFF